MLVSLSAIVFTVLNGIVFLFQGALVVGMPWGAASMGGKFPGKYPPKMRFVAILNMILLAFITAIGLSEANMFFPELKSISGIGIWIVVGFFGIGTFMNTVTPSKIERIWAPVAGLQFITSLIIALS